MMINVKVKPNSSKQKIEKFGDTKKSEIFGDPKTKGFCGNRFLIYLKEKPEKNKANIELINLLSKYFGVPYTHIKIKNPASKNKIIELELK